MRRAAAVLTCVTAVLLGLVGAAGVAQAEPPGRYVALGDSYSAGPLVPPPTGPPIGCLRSARNFPAIVAEGLQVRDFADVSCSGATTVELTTPQPVPFGTNPAQFSALTGAEALVTITIGGNDIGFGEIVRRCALASPTDPAGAPCKAAYGGELEQRITEAGGAVGAALAEIGRRSPGATVALVGYPALLPDKGPGCFPIVPFGTGDVVWLRGIEKSLNAELARRAAIAGALFVDTYTPTIGHDMCQPTGVKWIEGIIPTSPAVPIHPNALGMEAMGAAVLAALGAGVQRSA